MKTPDHGPIAPSFFLAAAALAIRVASAGAILAAANGCVLAAGAAAGAIVADEISERDGEFDPLEEAYDGDKRTRPILKED